MGENITTELKTANVLNEFFANKYQASITLF